MFNKSEAPILITGVERSGSTIIAKIISHCGVYTGVVNSRYENISLKKNVNHYYKNILKINETGQFPYPNEDNLLIPKSWKSNTLKLIQVPSDMYWMYKSSRITQLWPVWNYAFPNAKYLLVRRRSADVINSCIKTAYMKAFKDSENLKLLGVSTEREGWKWWIHQFEKSMTHMIEGGLNCRIIWPERMKDGDYQQMIETIEWLGLKWDDSIIKMVENSFVKERN